MTNDEKPQATAADIAMANLHARISRLEAENRALEVEVEAEEEVEWADFEEEEPDDQDDVKVLERIEKALPDGHVLMWAHDDDGNLMTASTAEGDDDDDDDQDDDE